ncbi:MAG: DNA internalization-related competence protein ComEC/Rec2 [Gallionellales bacterium GWA2_60_18]|nr:MAG: DNA internalization-related competence protein ComEC/Rec2 [Gallionellales bacterium GWA2_60_18]
MVVFAVAFTLGVWLLQQQAALPGFVWAWSLLLLAPALFIPQKQRWLRFLRTLLIAALACGLGFFHAAWQAEQRLAVSLADEWQGRDIALEGVVAELPRSHERGLRFRFEVERTLTPLAVVPERLYLSTYSTEGQPGILPKAGERWRFTVRLKQPHGGSNPHGFDFEYWALERGIRALGYVHGKGDNLRLDAAADGLGYRIEAWRERVRDRLNEALADAPYAGILSALAIGDQNSIAQPQWQLFARTGVTHLMSISGLHITMLSGLGFAFCYWLWRRSARLTLLLPARKTAAVFALLTAIGYALLAGFGVPAQRTVYMVGAVAAALWLNRNFSSGQILAIALLGVLIPDPWAVLSPGFWLSFGAVALIFHVTAHRIRDKHASQDSAARLPARLWRVLKEYAGIQWAMTIGLTPLLLGLFQQVSLVSPVANAVAIPLVSLIVVPLTLLGAALPLELPLWLAHAAMSATMSFLGWLNALPQAVWTQHAPPAWSVACGLAGAVWLLLPRGFPARWLGVPLLLPMFLNAPQVPAQGALRLVVFDVGQGLAVAAQTKSHALLYDAGPDFSGEADSGNRILVPALRALGIAALDGMILSHDDLDHTGGAASILQAMPVGWLSSSLPDGHALLQTAAAENATTRRCMDGQSWQWDSVDFELLHPDADSHGDTKPRDNERSCVLRIGIGKRAVLLTGDIGKSSEARLTALHADKLSVDLLVVPHHGSKNSSSIEFVAATLPDYAVFTSGYRNRFGHPHETVQQRYADSGAELLRSDEDGAILVGMDGQGLKVERYRRTHRRYWTHQSS